MTDRRNISHHHPPLPLPLMCPQVIPAWSIHIGERRRREGKMRYLVEMRKNGEEWRLIEYGKEGELAQQGRQMQVGKGRRERTTDRARVLVLCVWNPNSSPCTQSLDTLKSPPQGLWGAVEMNQDAPGAEPAIGEPLIHCTLLHSLLCAAATLSHLISHFSVEIGYSGVSPGDYPIWG